ncbi:MFS transporter [Sphingosinicella terrae]|uniref:MFS transporter n=1 Tax=Sphingosinicella terrae TaxID=2172047 RepID=UPI000E0DE993|nr:MFS transporter [Sphingosinicella terrae]
MPAPEATPPFAPARPFERFASRSPVWALILLTAISTCGFIDRIIMNVLVQPIKAEFALTDTEVGLVAGLAFAILYVLLGIWVARIAERRRRLTLIGIGTFLWSLATAACAFATSFLTLALARVGVGVGEAVGLPAGQSVVSDYFPKEKRTSALAVLLLAPPLGAFIGSAGGATIAQLYGWRMAFLIAAIPGLLLSALVLFTVAEPPRGQHDRLGADADTVPPLAAVVARMWRRHAFRHLLAGSTVASLVGFGLNAFLAAFLFRRFGFSVAEAGVIAGLIASAPATIGVLGSGWLTDRIARRDARAYGLLPGVSLLLAAPIYALAVTRETPAAAIALLAVAAFVQYTYLAPAQGVFQNLMHPRMRATSTAIVQMIYALIGGGLGPLLVGALSDAFAPDSTPAGSSAGLVAAMAVTTAGYLWAALHFLRATKRIREELELPL